MSVNSLVDLLIKPRVLRVLLVTIFTCSSKVNFLSKITPTLIEIILSTQLKRQLTQQFGLLLAQLPCSVGPTIYSNVSIVKITIFYIKLGLQLFLDDFYYLYIIFSYYHSKIYYYSKSNFYYLFCSKISNVKITL